MDKGADVNAKDNFGVTPLQVAYSCLNDNIAQMLAEHGATGDDVRATLKIKGVGDAVTENKVIKAVVQMLDYSDNAWTWRRSGDVLSVRVAPITNIEAFAKNINFGTDGS